MAYQSWSVVAGEIPTAAKWNILGTNDSSFNDGTGIGTGAIGSTKLNLTGSQAAVVLTSQTTTSTSYTDLATAGPSVTVTVNASGLVLVGSHLELYTSGANEARAAVTLSGANAVSADDDQMCVANGSGTVQAKGGVRLYTGLTAGSTTFKLQYRVSASTGTFLRRRLYAVPL